MQYQVTLTSNDRSGAILDSISLTYQQRDPTAPTTNATTIVATPLANDGWTNTPPTLSWTAGDDNVGGEGILGYCIALDGVVYAGEDTVSDTVDPENSAGSALSGLDDGIDNAACPYIVTGTSIDLENVAGLTLVSGRTYFFSIKALDQSSNVWAGDAAEYQDLFSFHYESASPTNVSYISTPGSTFANVDDMSFSWPSSGSGVASDALSGVLGYQYQINGTDSTWKGTTTSSLCGFDYIPVADGSYQLTQDEDGASIAVGNNIVYFRTVDAACNISSSTTYRTGNLAYGGAAPQFDTSCNVSTGIAVTPSSNTANSFALSWEAANPAVDKTIAGYYYMVNTTPPSSLDTITTNTATYISTGTSRSVSTKALSGAVKGANTVYVVAVDNDDNYSASNCIKGTFTLDSEFPDPPKNLSIADASVRSPSLWRASLGWDVPDYTGTGTLTYQVQRSTDGESWTTVTNTTGTSYIDTVPESRKYYWRVASYDSSDESQNSPSFTNAVTLVPRGTYTDAPELTSGPTVSSITTKRATITWSTARAADSRVQYGTKSGEYLEEEPSKSDQVTDHSITLNNLAPGVTYYYRTKWIDEDGNQGISTEKNFRTQSAPTAKDVSVFNIGLTTASLRFTVTGANKVRVSYGTTPALGLTKEIFTSDQESTYTTLLEELSDGTKYYYRINTLDSEGDEYAGTVLDFTTLPQPRISNIRVQEAAGAAQTTTLVTWQTNTQTSSVVTYYPAGRPEESRDEVTTALKTGNHRILLRGLRNETLYNLVIRVRDQAGNEALSSIQQFTTATDTRPPQITDLKTEGVPQKAGTALETGAQIIVSWKTDEPSTSQVEFGEGTGSSYSQRTQEDTNLLYDHVVVISGLAPSQVYHLRALSKDINGNTGTSVDTITITPRQPDQALNLVISNLQEVFGFLGK